MKIRAVIVDDEPKAREVLRHFLSKHPEIRVIGEGSTGKDAVKLADELDPDVLFLDVKMPEIDGLSAARIIASSPDAPKFIFTTAFEEHAVDAFEVEAVDYLVKPYTASRVNMAVERLVQRLQAEVQNDLMLQELVERVRPVTPRRIPFDVVGQTGEKVTVFVNEDHILFVEAQGHRTRIVTIQSEIEVAANLGEVENWLDNRVFFKSHRSYLVNLHRVTAVKTTGRTFGIALEGGQKYGLIPLSRGRVDELKELLSMA